MTTAATFHNLKIDMDKVAASSSLCSEGDDNDDIVSTPTPAFPSALASNEFANEDDKLLLPNNTDTDTAVNTDCRHDYAKPSHLNGSNSKSSNGIGSNSNNFSSLLSHNNKIRLLYFFFRFSTGSLVPFMSLYMQHVGLRPDQIGTLQAIRPIVTMTSAPLWGGLADRTGRKKMVLMVSSKIIWSSPQSLSLIPPHFRLLLKLLHTHTKGHISFQLPLSTICMLYIK